MGLPAGLRWEWTLVTTLAWLLTECEANLQHSNRYLQNTTGILQCAPESKGNPVAMPAGYVIYCIGCVTYALGPIIQKFAYAEGVAEKEEENNENGEESEKAPAGEESEEAPADEETPKEGGEENKLRPKRPCLWLFGVIIYMASGALWAVAFIFVPIAKVQPLLAVAVILNFVFARLLLGEPIKKWDAYGTIPTLCVAVLLAGLFSNSTDVTKSFETPIFVHNGSYAQTTDCTAPFHNGTLFCKQAVSIIKNQQASGALACELSMRGFMSLVTRGYFLGYSLIMIAILVGFLLLANHFERKELTTPLSPKDLFVLQVVYGCASGSSGGLASATIALWQSQFKVAGTFSCITPIANPLVWLNVVAMCFFEVGQIYFVNKGIVRFPVNVITTMEVISNSVVAGLAGTVAFEGLSCFEPGVLYPALYSVGILLEIVGCVVMVVSNYKSSSKGEGNNALELATPKADDADKEAGGDSARLSQSRRTRPDANEAVRISRMRSSHTLIGVALAAGKGAFTRGSSVISRSTRGLASKHASEASV